LVAKFVVVFVLRGESLWKHQISWLTPLQAKRRFGILFDVWNHFLYIALLLVVPSISILSFFWHLLDQFLSPWRIEFTFPIIDFGSDLIFLQSFSIEVIYRVSKLFDWAVFACIKMPPLQILLLSDILLGINVAVIL
jgi:hypothetical protein